MIRKLILPFFIVIIFLAGCSYRSDSSGTSGGSEGDTALIENIGSDTILNIAVSWAEFYQNNYPGVRIYVTGGGSGTGIAALINGTADIANASRPIKDKEIENAQANGIEPIEWIIAGDAIAIIVHPDNPVDKLSLEQISDIYSGKISNWKELGGDDRPIVRLSRETNSGTHIYFLEEVLRLGDKENQTLFERSTLLLPSSEGIISEVSQNPNAIGYDGLGYVTDAVKVLEVAGAGSDTYVYPSIATVNDQTYPIARDLYMYTNGMPEGIVKTYLDWILSPEAQQIVKDLGFVPVEEK